MTEQDRPWLFCWHPPSWTPQQHRHKVDINGYRRYCFVYTLRSQEECQTWSQYYIINSISELQYSSSFVIGSIIVGIQMFTIFFLALFFLRSFISIPFNLFRFFYSSFHLFFSFAFPSFSFIYLLFLSISFIFFVFIVTFFPTLENSIQVNFRLLVRKQSEALNVISLVTIACLNSASIPAWGEVCPEHGWL